MTRQAVSGKRLSVWTSLPVSPIDGDEILYRFVPTQFPATTIPILWHMRWDAAAAAWLPVNQAEPIVAAYAPGAAVSMGGNSWGTYDANDPRVTVPRAGVYELETGVGEVYGIMNGFYIGTGINAAPNTTTTGEASTSSATNTTQIGGSMHLKTPEVALVVGDNVRQYYYLWGATNNIVMRGRYLQIRPKKITG